MGADSINRWMIIYRGYTGDQLATERATLTRWLNNPYDSQTQGPKGYARNPEALADRLAALQRVVNESTNVGANEGRIDASGGIHGAAGSLYNNCTGTGSGDYYPRSW